jgi:hypothetical protein
MEVGKIPRILQGQLRFIPAIITTKEEGCPSIVQQS